MPLHAISKGLRLLLFVSFQTTQNKKKMINSLIGTIMEVKPMSWLFKGYLAAVHGINDEKYSVYLDKGKFMLYPILFRKYYVLCKLTLLFDCAKTYHDTAVGRVVTLVHLEKCTFPINVPMWHYYKYTNLTYPGRVNTTGINPPWATLVSRGVHSCWTPNRDVMLVLLYRTKYKTQKGVTFTNTRDIWYKVSYYRLPWWPRN